MDSTLKRKSQHQEIIMRSLNSANQLLNGSVPCRNLPVNAGQIYHKRGVRSGFLRVYSDLVKAIIRRTAMSETISTSIGVMQKSAQKPTRQSLPTTSTVFLIIVSIVLTACGGSSSDDKNPTVTTYSVTTSAGTGGSFDSSSATVDSGSTTSFSITLDTGYSIDSVTGCDGSLMGTTYTTGAVTSDCTVNASFAINQYTVSTTAGTGGGFDLNTATVNHADSTTFNVTADTGYSIDSVTGCDGSLTGTTYTTGAVTNDCTVDASFAINQYTVSAIAATGGSFDQASATVNHGDTTTFNVTADNGFRLDAVTGCAGSLSGTTYTTGSVTADCTVNASFIAQYTVTTSADTGGSFDNSSATVDSGSTTSFVVTADSGYAIGSVIGCNGSLNGSTYTTGNINADCTVTATFLSSPASAPSPSLSVATKTLQFSWAAVANTDHYRILVNPDGASGFSVVPGAENIAGLSYDLEISVHLLDWVAAEYLVEACNTNDSVCLSSPSQTLTAADSIVATGYFKASNTDADDHFGVSVSVSGDGNTLAVGAPGEGSNATGIDGDQNDDSAAVSGAVYIFTKSGGSWSQQAYLKASNSEAGDLFGAASSLSGDGQTLAVGAYGEDSNATGIDGDQTDNSTTHSGAVYVFTRVGSSWTQQAYVKASNTGADDEFGVFVSLANDGNTLAVGARYEGSSATGIDGDQADNSLVHAGAVYVFTRTGSSWGQQAYVKASNSGENDYFGRAVSLSGDGNTLAVGAWGEDSNAYGIDGNQADNSQPLAGAAYVFIRVGSSWSQQVYLKNHDIAGLSLPGYDFFGNSVSLSNDGNTLAVGSHGKSLNDFSNPAGGTALIFTRNGSSWSEQRFIATNHPTSGDAFGYALNLSGDGKTLAVGAFQEDSNATGIDGDQTDESAQNAGAVWVYHRKGASWAWPAPEVQHYVKASNTEAEDTFGFPVSLSDDGQTLAVGAYGEDSNATDIGGDQADNTATDSGAVYVY
jgi:trimeric autotransporter adhesin